MVVTPCHIVDASRRVVVGGQVSGSGQRGVVPYSRQGA